MYFNESDLMQKLTERISNLSNAINEIYDSPKKHGCRNEYGKCKCGEQHKEECDEDKIFEQVTKMLDEMGIKYTSKEVETKLDDTCKESPKNNDSPIKIKLKTIKVAKDTPELIQEKEEDTKIDFEENNKHNDIENGKDEEVCEHLFEDTIDKRIIVLRYSNRFDNYPYYNAVLHICNEELFPNTVVYGEDEIHENIDEYIVLPNVFGKITACEASYYAKLMSGGATIYFINPKTFELKQVKEFNEIWECAMDDIQESINCQ